MEARGQKLEVRGQMVSNYIFLEFTYFIKAPYLQNLGSFCQLEAILGTPSPTKPGFAIPLLGSVHQVSKH